MVTSLPNARYRRALDVTDRFTELVARPEPEIPLDEAALLIAAHAHPELDVDARLARARRAGGASRRASRPSELATLLFVDEGFRGQRLDDYGDPRNSFLDDVLDRRLGIPITLSVLMMEVGRRCGVALHGVGMPGHFLVGGGAGEWFDPFHAGARLDLGGCAGAVRGDARRTPASGPQFLAPVGPRAIAAAHARQPAAHATLQRDPKAVVWVARLRLRVPGIALSERGDLAGLLGRLGQFAEAARELDVLAELLPGDEGEQAARGRARGREAPSQRAGELSDARRSIALDV